VGAALCVGLGGQIGIGIATVASKPLTSRDYFVVGAPVLLGTMVAFLPQTLFDALPGSLQVFVGNSLITGIFLVLVLEHLLLRNKKAPRIHDDGGGKLHPPRVRGQHHRD
jgi:xanthine/uracil permease